MKRLLGLLGAVVASVALAQAYEIVVSTTQPGTSTVAQSFTGSLSGTALDLTSVNGFRTSVCATQDGGVTSYLAGAGALNAYLADNRTGQILRNPAIDWTVSVNSTSCGGGYCQCQVFPDQEVAGRVDQVIYLTNGVKVALADGGNVIGDGTAPAAGQVTVKISGWKIPRN